MQVKGAGLKYLIHPPDAASLMTSARRFGNYDLSSALADLIDNSIKARARTIDIRCVRKADGPGRTRAAFCHAKRTTDIAQRQHQARIMAQRIKVVGIFMPQAIASMRARKMSWTPWMTRLSSRRPAMHPARAVANPSPRSACASSNTPPSEVSFPPSNAAVTFLRQIAGNRKFFALSCHMLQVAFCPDELNGVCTRFLHQIRYLGCDR